MYKPNAINRKIGLSVLTLFLVLLNNNVWSCTLCSTDLSVLIRKGIFNNMFLWNLAYVVLPIALIGIILYLRHQLSSAKNKQTYYTELAALLIGFGMGGFVDGILFHQILQIHHMLSNILYPNDLVKMQINMFWDGIFHAFTWITTFIGILLLWKATQAKSHSASNKTFFGGLLFGAGAFNFIEGLIDHQILQLHHVIQLTTPHIQKTADYLFIFAGIILIFLGIYLLRSGTKEFS